MKKSQKRKATRLAAERVQRRVAKDPIQRECHVTATKSDGLIVFQARMGYFSPRVGPVFALHELEVVEALDNPNVLVETIMKAGIAVLAGCLRTPVMGKQGQEALKDLAAAAAKWMKIDVEGLKAELAKEAAEEAREKAQAVVDGIVAESTAQAEAQCP